LIFVVVALAVASACAGLVVRAVDGPVERFTLDVRYKVRGAHAPSSAVTIVAIDDDALRGVDGGFRMPRRRQAEVVTRLTRAGAAVIAYNLALTSLTLDDADADLLLVRALRRAPAAVVSSPNYDARGRPLDPLAGIALFTKTVQPGSTRRHFDDRDGSWVRFLPPLGSMHSFATVAAGQYRRTDPVDIPAGALIDFAGDAGTYERIPFREVERLGTSDLARRVGGKVVVVADTSAGGAQLQPVPVGGVMAAGELQANAIATAIDGFPLRQVSPRAGVVTTIGLGVLGTLSLLVGRLGRRRRGLSSPSPAIAALYGIGLAAGWLVVAQLLFNSGTVVELFGGLVALLAAGGLAALVAMVMQRQELHELQRRAAEGDAALAGVDVGPYELIEEITDEHDQPVGSMGTLWKARAKGQERLVAIKYIDTDLKKYATYRRRFVKEARAAVTIEHDHLVPVHNIRVNGGVMSIEMRLLEGGTLASRLRAPTHDLVTMADILLRVARALDALHARGLVHGDVKPHNVLFATPESDHPYLSDFGLCVRIGEPVTIGGKGAGTAAYVSPEQTAGEPVAPTADVYSLAVMAFEALTGTRPFNVSPDAFRELHRGSPRPSAHSRNPRLPLEVDDIFRSALAPDPADRYGSASAFVTALRDVLRNAPPPPAARGTDAPTLLD
jgi:CHASE2 domain-containing sensor protein